MPKLWLDIQKNPWTHALSSFTHTIEPALADRESSCSSKPFFRLQLWDALVLYFKGQGHSGPHAPGSYTVMRPIRRLLQGGIQSFAVSIPLSNPTRNKSLTLSSETIQNLGNNEYGHSLNSAANRGGHMTLFPQLGTTSPSHFNSDHTPPLASGLHLWLPLSPPDLYLILSCPLTPCLSLSSSLPSAQCHIYEITHIQVHTDFDSHSSQHVFINKLFNLDKDNGHLWTQFISQWWEV